MNAFEQIKEKLISRGYDRGSADAQAASYTRLMNDDDAFDDEEIEIACMQIESMN